MNNALTKKLNGTPEQIRLYQRERAIVEVTELISQVMDGVEVNKSELANRLGKTKGHITQLLNGANMTIGTMSDVFGAMGKSIHFFVSTLATVDPPAPNFTFPLPVESSWKEREVEAWGVTEPKYPTEDSVFNGDLSLAT